MSHSCQCLSIHLRSSCQVKLGSRCMCGGYISSMQTWVHFSLKLFFLLLQYSACQTNLTVKGFFIEGLDDLIFSTFKVYCNGTVYFATCIFHFACTVYKICLFLH